MLATGTRPLLFVNDGQARFAPVPDAFRFRQPLQGVLTSIAMADYDRDGFLDLYLCVYSYFFGAGEDKAGTPAPYYDARNGPPGVLLRNDGRGRFVDATQESGLDAGNDRYHFAAAWADYDGDGWPDLLVANDFGTKNLYRNRGRQDGRVTFEDVAATAGVLDHGAGMSAAFLDYDNDGLLDIYTGNMWSDAGLRVTSASTFMPDAPAEVRALYRRHVRGNSLFRNRGDGRFEDKTIEARAEMGRWAWSSDALDFDSDGWEDLYVANGMLTRPGEAGGDDLESFFWRQIVARSPLTRVKGTPYDDAWRAINQLLIHGSIASRQRNVFLRNDGQGGFDDVSGAVGLDLDQDGRSFAVLDIDRDGDPDLVVMAARQAPQLRVFRNDFASKAGVDRHPPGRDDEQPRRDWRARERRDRAASRDEDRAGRFGVPLAALEGAALRPGSEPARREGDGRVALGRQADLHRREVEHARAARRGRHDRIGAVRASSPPRTRRASRRRQRRLRIRRGSTNRSRRLTSRTRMSTERRARSRRSVGGRRSCCSGRSAPRIPRRVRRACPRQRRVGAGGRRRARDCPRSARGPSTSPRGVHRPRCP